MDFKRGDTYKLLCRPERIEDIEKLVFALESTKKTYKSDGTGDIQNDNGTLIISLTQAETLILSNKEARCEIAVKKTNGDVIRSKIESGIVYDTIIEEAI